MSDDSVRREFVALSIPFQFIHDKLFNKIGLILLYFCSWIITFFALSERNVDWWMYILGSIFFTIPCFFVLFTMSYSAAMSDLFSELILGKIVKDARPDKLIHRFAHAVLAIAMFTVIFGIMLLVSLGYIDDGCDGRYPRC